jgi:hypothetical protein
VRGGGARHDAHPAGPGGPQAEEAHVVRRGLAHAAVGVHLEPFRSQRRPGVLRVLLAVVAHVVDDGALPLLGHRRLEEAHQEPVQRDRLVAAHRVHREPVEHHEARALVEPAAHVAHPARGGREREVLGQQEEGRHRRPAQLGEGALELAQHPGGDRDQVAVGGQRRAVPGCGLRDEGREHARILAARGAALGLYVARARRYHGAREGADRVSPLEKNPGPEDPRGGSPWQEPR